MSLKFAAGVIAAMAIGASPAFACKGPTTLLLDNFQTVDPAWALSDGLAISGGNATVTATAGGTLNYLNYEGQFFDTADVCVNMVSPTVSDPTTALGGIMFGLNNGGYWLFLVEEDGKAQIVRNQNGGWLTPVTMRAAPSLKTGANVSNTLRLTYKGTSGSAYINDTLFVTFTIPQAFQNTQIGLYAENDAATGGAAITYTFSNLDITNVP
jgi:hypothetical protein